MTELRVYSLGAIGDVPIMLYWGLLVVFCGGMAYLLWRKGLREGLRQSAVLLLVEWVLLVLAITVLFRETRDECRINLAPLSSYFDIAENSYLMEKVALNILNVALFVPIGLLLGCGFRSLTWGRVLAIGAGLSVLIEVLQLVFRKGLCETDDVIHNVAGCMIGYGIVIVLRHLSLARKQ